jgi:hypothetical protein
MERVLIAFLVIATFLSIAIALTLSSALQAYVEARGQGTTNAASKLRGLSVWQVGSSNALLDALLSELEARGSMVARSADLKDFPAKVAPLKDVLIVFSGDWLAGASSNGELQAALQRVRERCKCCAFVAVGGRTSSLFDVLDRAGIYRLDRVDGVVRNPAYYNPPVAGITWKVATTPTGETYAFPSIFECGAPIPNTIADALASWLGG